MLGSRWGGQFTWLALVAAALVGLAACAGEALVFPDWTVPVPEGTRVFEYRGVPIDERESEPIRMVREVEIGRDSDDPDYSFYQAHAMTTDDDGNMYVANSGTHDVLVYAPDGRFVRRFGREGQGPGEFNGEITTVFTFAAGKLTIDDDRSPRYSIWDSRGNHLEDIPYSGRAPRWLTALEDGTYVGRVLSYRETEAGALREEVITHFDERLTPLSPIAEMPDFGQTALTPTPNPWPSVGRDGSVYLTPAAEYEVFSYSLTGKIEWALRATWEREPVTADIRDDLDPYLRIIREQGGRVPEIEWPQELPALRYALADGHGHLYVFPYVYFNEMSMLRNLNPRYADLPPLPEAPELLPVDVYSSDGERLYAGMIESHGGFVLYWDDARGDYIYQLTTDFETGETYLAKFRLVEPF